MIEHPNKQSDADHKSKRILVIGSGGRLGSSLMEFLKPDHQVIGFDHKQLDLGSGASIDAALAGLAYDQLILTGSLTAVDYCETHEAESFAVNTEGPGRIAEISAAKGAHMTYISTDLVFDGTKDCPYVESDRANPISVYGASKLAGEKIVIETSKDNLVIRTSWLFGPARPAFPEWVIGKVCSDPNLSLPENKTACPTYTLDLIVWMAALMLGRPGGPASGIIHLCNSSPCTWLEWGSFCVDFAHAAGMPVVAREVAGIPVDSVPAFVAKRPHNSALSTGKFSALTGIHPRSWRAALRDYLIQQYPEATHLRMNHPLHTEHPPLWNPSGQPATRWPRLQS